MQSDMMPMIVKLGFRVYSKARFRVYIHFNYLCIGQVPDHNAHDHFSHMK